MHCFNSFIYNLQPGLYLETLALFRLIYFYIDWDTSSYNLDLSRSGFLTSICATKSSENLSLAGIRIHELRVTEHTILDNVKFWLQEKQ